MRAYLLRMKWRHLLFASWPMDAEAIQGKLPAGLQVDRFDGSAWVSLVAFENVDVRLKGAPRALGVDLLQLNLRTYVTHDERPGAYFFSMETDGLGGVLGARIMFALPYHWARVRLLREGDRFRFESRRRHPGGRIAAFAARYRPLGHWRWPRPGSLDGFLLERYRLYTKSPIGLACLEVDHEPWRVQDVAAEFPHNSMFQAEGLPEPVGPPVCHYGTGRDVEGSPLVRA